MGPQERKLDLIQGLPRYGLREQNTISFQMEEQPQDVQGGQTSDGLLECRSELSTDRGTTSRSSVESSHVSGEK